MMKKKKKHEHQNDNIYKYNCKRSYEGNVVQKINTKNTILKNYYQLSEHNE